MSATDDAAPPGAVNIPASADTTPGVLLREARERAGMSQDDIAGKLKLAPRQIAAIETGDWNSLPERTFTRGFMRSYARIVGLNPDIVGLDRSPSQPNAGGELKPTPEAIGEVTMEHGRDRTSAARWAVPFLLIAVLAAGVAYFQWGELIGLGALKIGGPPAQSSGAKASSAATNSAAAPAVPSATKASDTVAPPAPPSSSGSVIAPAISADAKDPAAAAAPTLLLPPTAPAATGAASLAPSPSLAVASPGEKRITITFKGKSWTEVRSKGDVIYSEASLPGTKEFNGAPPLSFIVGNASNVVLNIDGRPYDMASITRNDVARFRIE